MNQVSNTSFLKINKAEGREHDYMVSIVNHTNEDDITEISEVALITNWHNKGTPYIKIPYYISNDILEQICQMIQTQEPPNEQN